MTRNQVYRRVGTFLALAFALSSIFYVLIIRSGSYMDYMLPLMLAPAVATIITKLAYDRNLSGLGWKPGPLGWLIFAYLLPIVYGGVVYGGGWLTGIGGFDTAVIEEAAQELGYGHVATWQFLSFYVAFAGTLSVVLALPNILGEELGWRGFLVPQLYRVMSFTRMSVVVGAIWVAYHLPLILFADYNTTAPKAFTVVIFTITVISMSFMYNWLRLKTNSVWPAVLLHALHNIFVLNIYDPLMTRGPLTDYFMTEFGLGICLIMIGLGAYFWSRRDELPAPERLTAEPVPADAPAQQSVTS